MLVRAMEHLPFGTFNPRFYGVSLFLSDPGRRDVVERYGRAGSSAEWARDAGTPSLSEVSTLSAVDHELRHFHDFLVSPLGTMTMGLRMQATINGFQAMQALGRCRGRFVPVPLLRWIEWDASMRQRWINSTGNSFGFGQSEDIISLPQVADIAHAKFQVGAQAVPDSLSHEQQLGVYALRAAQAYASMEMWRQRQVSQFDMDVSADDVFEGTAHLVQSQAVWIGQGEAATERYFDFVLTSSAKHLAPLQLLWEALQRSSHTIGVQRVTELFTWMLLGSQEQLASSDHPACRYFRVLELAASSPDEDIFVDRMPSAQLFDRLDSLSRSSAWKSNLESASDSADRRRDSYSRLAQTLKGGYFDALFAVAISWHDDQRSAKQTFLKDPEALAHPLRYLREKRFPLPLVETRLGWMVHERDEPLDSTKHRIIAVDPDGKRVLSYISKLDPEQAPERLDSAASTRLLTHMVDFLFGDEPVFDLYVDWCKSLVQPLIGKILVSVY